MKIRGNTVGTTLKPERAIVKCQNLTEEQKAKARENIGVDLDEYATKAYIDEQLGVIENGSY